MSKTPGKSPVKNPGFGSTLGEEFHYTLGLGLDLGLGISLCISFSFNFDLGLGLECGLGFNFILVIGFDLNHEDGLNLVINFLNFVDKNSLDENNT